MKNRMPLIMLALVFVVPFIVGKLVYSGFGPDLKTINHGELVQAQSLSSVIDASESQAILAAGKSIYLVFIQPEQCGQSCVLTRNWVDDAYRAMQADAALVGKYIGHGKGSTVTSGDVYLVDKKGRLILRYPMVSNQAQFFAAGEGLLADMKRLLKGIRA